MPVYVCISFVTYEHPLYSYIFLHRGRFVYCPFLLVRFKFGPDADFSPYYAPGIIALDACTAHTGFVNCIVIEDEELPQKQTRTQALSWSSELTDDEKIDIVAERILKKYKPAFEELAK